LLAIEGI